MGMPYSRWRIRQCGAGQGAVDSSRARGTRTSYSRQHRSLGAQNRNSFGAVYRYLAGGVEGEACAGGPHSDALACVSRPSRYCILRQEHNSDAGAEKVPGLCSAYSATLRVHGVVSGGGGGGGGTSVSSTNGIAWVHYC